MIWTGVDLKSNERPEDFDVNLNRLGSWMGLMAESPNKDENLKINVSDIKTAEYFGARIAKITKKFKYIL